MTGCALRLALWLAVAAAWLAWRAPSLVVAAGALLAGRLRFGLVIGLGRALVAVGWRGAARRLYAAEMARAERRRRALAGRRGW